MSEPVASRFLAWVENSFPSARASLRAPASRELIERVRLETGHDLPPTLQALWLAHDGQQEHAEPLFESFEWLSVSEALAAAAMTKGVLEEVGREYNTPERWLPQWLPFAQDLGGGLLGVDLVSGEVFEWQHDGEGRERTWGQSFDGFIDTYLERFARGALRVDPQHGVVETNPAPLPPRREPEVPTRRRVIGLALVVLSCAAMAFFVYWLESHRPR